MSSPWSLVCLSLFLLTAPSVSNVGQGAAAEKKSEKTEVDVPLAVVSVASADRLLNDVHFTFKTAGATGMSDVLNGLLGNVNDLKGMDRSKPFGVMVFLKTGLPPQPVVIGFLPVKNIDELLKTVSNGPFAAQPVKGKKNRYEVSGPNGVLQILLKKGYAFIGKDEDALDRTFPDPAKIAAPLAARFDIAVVAKMNSIPKETRKLLAVLFRASAEAELQQRDEEPRAAYESRHANGMNFLEFVEYVLLDTEEVVFGIDASSKNRNLVLEASLQAVPHSKLSKYLKEKAGKRSYFANLVNASHPLSASLSVGLTKNEAQAMGKTFKFLATRVTRGLHRAKTGTAKSAGKTKKPQPADKNDDTATAKEKNGAIPKNPAIETILTSLIATANKRHADLFVQVVGTPPKKFSLIAGLQVSEGRSLAGGLKDLLNQVAEIKDAPKVQLNAFSYKGVKFHKIPINKAPDRLKNIFGRKPRILFGAGSRVVWVALGGEDVKFALRKAIDTVAEPPREKTTGDTHPAARFAFNVSSWLAVTGNADRPQPVRDLAREAFSKGGDDIRIEARFPKNAFRLKVQLGTGFIRMIGMGIQKQYERNQQKN